MKLVTALIRPEKFHDVKDALEDYGIHGMTISDAAGYGIQHGHQEVYRGASYTVDLLQKLRLEILTTDGRAHEIAEVVVSAARTGSPGDGKVWIQTVEDVIRVRTGERDHEALLENPEHLGTREG